MSFGAVLGGALQGLGTGIARQGESDAASRREIALENLRAQRQRDQTTLAADLQDRNAGNQAVREDWKDSRGTARDTTKAVTVEGVKFKYDQAIEGQRQAGARSLEQLRQAGDITKTEYDARLKEEADIRASNREIKDIVTLPNGQLMGITASGETRAIQGRDRATGARRDVLAAPNEDDEGPTSALDRARAARSGSPAAPAPERAPAAERQGDPAARTYTLAEAKATAQARGVPLTEVHRIMRANGFKLSGS